MWLEHLLSGDLARWFLSLLSLFQDFREIGSFDNNRRAEHPNFGGLAQLARAPALHAGGHRFDSDILHNYCRELGVLIKLSLFHKQRMSCFVLLQGL